VAVEISASAWLSTVRWFEEPFGKVPTPTGLSAPIALTR
jgi:hypothetical protein